MFCVKKFLLKKTNFKNYIISFILCQLILKSHPLSTSTKSDNDSANQVRPIVNNVCPPEDLSCQEDSEGFQAISQLHSLIDDDHDGGLDRTESEEFFREDLKMEGGNQNFHKNDDFITVYDLWSLWYRCVVYNWTVEDVVSWLNNYVELPQYSQIFTDKAIDGKYIPRMATNFQSFSSQLGIKSAVHKQKLSIKSTDLVLFGPPKSPRNIKKDLAVLVSLLIGIGGCFFAYRQQKLAHLQMQKVLKDLSSLQKAEDALTQVQTELEKAQKEQQIIADDKQCTEKMLKHEILLAKAEAEQLKNKHSSMDASAELKQIEDELIKVKVALMEAEKRLEENQYIPLMELQIWLQLTYEVEKKYFEAKREAAQMQLLAAREMWEKIRKQKSKFLGSFRVAHTTSLDETDQQIMKVRSALDNVKVELQERIGRWQGIEKLCRFNISMNPGLEALLAIVKSNESFYSTYSLNRSSEEQLEQMAPSLNK